MTLAQARLLVAAVLELDKLTPVARLLIAAYHDRRNYIAYHSHRKTRLKELRGKGIEPKFLDEQFDQTAMIS